MLLPYIESIKKRNDLQNEKVSSEQYHKLCVWWYIYSQESKDMVCGNNDSYKIPCLWFFLFPVSTLIRLDFIKVVSLGKVNLTPFPPPINHHKLLNECVLHNFYQTSLIIKSNQNQCNKLKRKKMHFFLGVSIMSLLALCDTIFK